MMDDFDNVLGAEIRARSRRIGNEWVIPFPEVVEAIDQASNAEIAVLGVDVFELLTDGIRCYGESVYDFRDSTNWRAFVVQNNDAAKQFVAQNTHRSGYGYILTVASHREHQKLGN